MSTISNLHLVPGTGLVQRHGNNVVALECDDHTDQFVTDVLRDCGESSGPDLLRRLAGRVLNDPQSRSIRLGVITPATPGSIAFLYGDIVLRTPDAVTSGVDLVTGVEFVLDEVPWLVVAPAGEHPHADDRTELTVGCVPASGFRIDFAPVANVAANDQPSGDDAAPIDVESPSEIAVSVDVIDEATSVEALDVAVSVDGTEPAADDVEQPPLDMSAAGDGVELILLQDAPTPKPLSRADADATQIRSEAAICDPVTEAEHLVAPEPVMVEGVRCARDHHNDPRAAYCAHCGLKMGAHRTLRPTSGPRPQLGVLVLDDGTTIPVGHNLVLGREPDDHEFVVDGHARSAGFDDPSQTVSRVHAHLGLEGWDVHLSDLGSSNGTFVRLASDDDWVELARQDRVRLTAGAMIRLGDRELLYQSHDIGVEHAS